MGNCVICGFVASARSVEVMFPSGEVQRIEKEAVKAAEIMMEKPNHFVVNSKLLVIGSKFSPLGADDELEPGNVYLVLPMERKGTRISASDTSKIPLKKDGRRRKIRVEPEPEPETMIQYLPKLNLEEITPQLFVHRPSAKRSRKPALETILEAL